MKISVKFSAQLRHLAGIDRASLTIDGQRTLQEFATWFAEGRGEPLKSSLLDGDGLLQKNLFVCVNDEQIDTTECKLLCGGDEVTFMLPVSGG